MILCHTHAVIPQNFLFDRNANERKFMRNPIWFLAERRPNRIPDKIAFPCLKAGKSDFSGMTILFGGKP
jgi:hypothetical protein